MVKACKSLFCGMFNFNHERYIEYSHAFTERQAWLVMCRRIAKKQGVIPSVVMNYFDGLTPNFSITKEIEFIEEEEKP